jgi:hypothetical protein
MPARRPAPRKPPPAALEARLEGARIDADHALTDGINAKVARLLADDPAHPMTDDQAAAADRRAAAARKRLAARAKAAGTTAAKVLRELDDQRRATRTAELERFRANLAVVRDMLDHPDAYLGVDLAGRPLDADALAVQVRELEHTIAVWEAELAELA